MLKLSLLIELTERVTAPVRKIRSAVKGMARDGQQDVGRLARSLDRLTASSGGINRAFRFGGARVGLGMLMRRVRELSGRAGMKGLELAAFSAGRAIGSTLRMVGKFALRGVAVAGAGAGFLGGWLTAGVIGTASKFEQFQVILENTEGSAAAAKRAMAWVEDFADRTPYELDQVMQAFVQLKAYGVDPMDGTLRSLGDAAAGMGKDLFDAVEAVADAQTGEFERLKAFTIQSKVEGDRVKFTYQKNGKDMTVTAKNTASAIKTALTGILDDRFAGMADRQSKTFAGLWSNLKDKFTKFQKSIADAGIFDWLKAKLQAVSDKVARLASNGTLQRWAKNISKWMETAGNKLWSFATKTDWNKLGHDIMTIARAIRSLANAIEYLNRQPKDALPAWMTNGPLGGKGLLPWIADRWREKVRSVPRQNRGFGPGRNSLGPVVPRLQPGGSPVRNWSAPPLLQRTSADIRQQLTIEVKSARGLEVRTTRLQSSDSRASINVNRGPLPVA